MKKTWNQRLGYPFGKGSGEQKKANQYWVIGYCFGLVQSLLIWLILK